MNSAALFSVVTIVVILAIPNRRVIQYSEDHVVSDSRLQKRMSIRVQFETVKDVLGRISKETGVSLLAEPRGLAEKNMFVFAHERTGSELLRYIGKAVRGEWERGGAGNEATYILRESPSERTHLKRLQAEYFRALGANLEKEVGVQQRICALPLSEVLKRTHALRTSSMADSLTPEQKKEVDLELRRLSVASAPNSGPILRLYKELSTSLIKSLLSGECLRFSTRPVGSMRALPLPIARALIRSRPDELAEWYANNIDKVEIRADFRIEQSGERLTLICRSQVLAPPHQSTAAGTDGTVTIIAESGSMPESKAAVSLPESLANLGEVTITLSAKRPLIDDPSTYVPERLLVDYLAELAKANPALCMIGDSDLKPITTPASLRGRLSTVFETLCRAAAFTLIGHSEEVLVLQSRTAHIDELASIPATVLRNVMSTSLLQQRLSLMDHAGIAARLTDSQIAGLRGTGRPRMFMWPPIGTQILHLAKYHLRFLASLDARQKEHLLSGKLLPFARLGSQQRKAYLRALESGPGRPDQIDASFTEAEAVRSGIRLLMDDSEPTISRGELVYSLGSEDLPMIRIPLSLPTPNLSYIPRQ